MEEVVRRLRGWEAYHARATRDGAVTPVIDRTYSLSEAPEAIRYLENGHARGKVVIPVPGQGA